MLQFAAAWQGQVSFSFLAFHLVAPLPLCLQSEPTLVGTDDVLALAGELGLLSALQRSMNGAEQQQLAEQALEARPGTVVRPAPATAAAASLCTRPKPAPAGGSDRNAGAVAAEGSADGGEPRSSATLRSGGGSRSPAPNPFAAAGLGSVLQQDAAAAAPAQPAAAAPAVHAAAPGDAQPPYAVAAGLQPPPSLEGLQSLLRLMGSGSS